MPLTAPASAPVAAGAAGRDHGGLGAPRAQAGIPARTAPEQGHPPAQGEEDGGTPSRAAILAALEAHRWNRSAAAASLGTSRTTLWRRMRELRIR